MKKPPELLKHHAILTNWRSYPEGSVERAKAIGMELLATCTNLEATIQLWELKCDIVAKEQAWRPLGLKSREDFIKAVTGRTINAADNHDPKPSGDIVTSNGLGKGNAADYLTARLKRDHGEIFQRLAAGEFTSVRQAAIAAGIVKVPSVLDQLRKLWAKATDADRRTFMDEVTDGR